MATNFNIKDTLFRITDKTNPRYGKVFKVCYKTGDKSGTTGDMVILENPGQDCPLFFDRRQITQLVPGIAVCQYREWYGDDEMKEGRFKNKGEASLLVWGTSHEICDASHEFIASINAVSNRPNAHARYEVIELRPYEQPAVVQFDDEGNFSF